MNSESLNQQVWVAVTRLTALFKGDPNGEEAVKNALAQLLRLVDPSKPYGTVLFDSLSRLTWSIAFEGVALRLNPKTKKPEVFLRKRADDDTAYPGEWHAPGSAFRPREKPNLVARRLSREFGSEIMDFKLVGQYFSNEQRGDFLSLIYLVKFDGEPRVDNRHIWCPVDKLPENTVNIHRDHLIPAAVAAYRSSH
ncbi:MAG: NUDIX domain-containing protein [Patescibacteria group bacterium]